jgi:hypothetical protein
LCIRVLGVSAHNNRLCLAQSEVRDMRTTIVIGIALALVVVIATACGSKTVSNNNMPSMPAGKVIKTVTAGKLTATLSNSTGQLKHGDQEVMLAFTDASGKPLEVGAVSLNFHMDQMGTMMAMNDAMTFTTTGMPGMYQGKVKVEVAGEWQGQLAYEGPAGSGKVTFTVTAH